MPKRDRSPTPINTIGYTVVGINVAIEREVRKARGIDRCLAGKSTPP
jgi:hypothetical protein